MSKQLLTKFRHKKEAYRRWNQGWGSQEACKMKGWAWKNQSPPVAESADGCKGHQEASTGT